MKTSNKVLPSKLNNPERNSIKTGVSRMVKSVHVILILLLITLLSSCMFPGPGRGGPGESHERHGHNERHGGNEGHGHDDHH